MGDVTKGIIGEMAAEAIRKAKEAKRKAIQSQIDQWNKKLSQADSQQIALTAEQSKLNIYMGEWDTQKSTYNGSDILSEVVILNVFEGVCADKIKDDLTDSVTQMDQTYSKVSGLNAHVGEQISLLGQYINVINAKLTSLRSELNSI